MKKITSALLLVCLLAALLCGCGTWSSPVRGKKVAYIMHMAESEIFTMWSDAAENTAKSLGMKYDAVFCNGSDDEWKKQVEAHAAEGYDGLLLSHGGEDYAYAFLKDILAKYPELKIVTFDTQFVDETGEKQTLDGVVQFFQQDAMLAELLLDYLTNDLFAGETVNILKVWKEDYITAFDRRQVGYERFETEGLINTVTTIAPDDTANAEESVYKAAKDALVEYDGEIDAIWCCYDLYARGVYRALTELGLDIPLVSVDICNADIVKMEEKDSPWKACATTNWNYNGEFGIRVLALEMTGEYDRIIDPMTETASLWLELPAYLITQAKVTTDAITPTTVPDLHALNAEESKPEWMVTSEWIDALIK